MCVDGFFSVVPFEMKMSKKAAKFYCFSSVFFSFSLNEEAKNQFNGEQLVGTNQ